MGLSHAAAGGIVFFAATLAGFQLSGDLFDQQEKLAADWEAFYLDQEQLDRTAFTIDDVRRFGASRTEITMTNTGATTIDASSLTVLYDGLPEVAVSWLIDGTVTDVWHPGGVIVVETAALDPNDVAVADALGVKAYWRK